MKVERNEEREKPFLRNNARDQVRSTFPLRNGSKGAACPRLRSFRGRKEEIQMRRTRRTRDQKEGHTDRSARERNPLLPWLPSHSRLASLPWRRRLPVPLTLLDALSALASSTWFVHPARSHSRNSIPLAHRHQSSLHDDGRLALVLAPSIFREENHRFTQREGSRKRGTRRRQLVHAHARYLALHDIEAHASPEQFDHLSTASHSRPRNIPLPAIPYVCCILLEKGRHDMSLDTPGIAQDNVCAMRR